MKKVNRFFVGMFFGAVLGGLITLMYAPESGTELREKVQSKATEIFTQIKEASQKRKEELEAEIKKYSKSSEY
ncbi:MAG TPA: YtxH domain-containing protein [Anaerolineae bacterium]|nr:YtxH domain-containing protein [Anaerolineae bacterium]